MLVGFSYTYAISAYHHLCCEFEISIRARCTTLCDKVCQWLSTCLWFSPDPPVSSTNKTDRRNLTEILLKVALNTIKQTNKHHIIFLNKIWHKNISLKKLIPPSSKFNIHSLLYHDIAQKYLTYLKIVHSDHTLQKQGLKIFPYWLTCITSRSSPTQLVHSQDLFWRSQTLMFTSI